MLLLRQALAAPKAAFNHDSAATKHAPLPNAAVVDLAECTNSTNFAAADAVCALMPVSRSLFKKKKIQDEFTPEEAVNVKVCRAYSRLTTGDVTMIADC